jgi:hypothetical protein
MKIWTAVLLQFVDIGGWDCRSLDVLKEKSASCPPVLDRFHVVTRVFVVPECDFFFFLKMGYRKFIEQRMPLKDRLLPKDGPPTTQGR